MQDEVIELLIHLFKSIKDTSFILENNKKKIKHQKKNNSILQEGSHVQ